MKQLIICNTYYQLILAVQMKRTIFKDNEVDIWLSDHSVNANEIAENVRDANIFHSVRYIQNKDDIYRREKFRKLLDVVAAIKSPEVLEIPLYDEIIYYNLMIELYKIADYYKQMNHPVTWSRFEEGVLSYNTDFACGNRVKLIRYFRRMLGRTDVFDQVDKYYCTEPTLKKTHLEWNLVPIPSFSDLDEEMRKLLNRVFSYTAKPIPQKYIFFASSSDIDGKPFGETKLILQVAEQVGIDNIIVKMHPRDTRSVYKERGIAVMNKSNVPWEVMQMNLDATDHVLLTVNSGSFLSCSTMLETPVKGVFLHSCIKNPTSEFKKRSKEIEDVLFFLHKQGKCLSLTYWEK